MGGTTVHSQQQNDTNAVIQATALNRYYGAFHAVKNLDLSLYKGEVLGLLGPNGAGKSSTMQMLTGNLSPSSGRVVINGIDLIEQPTHAKQSLGYLPEQPPVYRDMTVTEYLNYCARLRGLTKSQKTTALSQASERCGLQTVQKKLIGNLSKGFQQRVGIAQAILHQPDVVILDEPTVGLDPVQIQQIRSLIRQLGNDHAVILSTHILPEVQAVCDRVQIINQGETVFVDSFAALATEQPCNTVLLGLQTNNDSKQLTQTLQKHPLITHAEVLPSKLNEARFRLHLATDTLTADALPSAEIYQFAQQNHWILTELSPEQQTLEQVFMQHVHAEGGPSNTSAPNEASA